MQAVVRCKRPAGLARRLARPLPHWEALYGRAMLSPLYRPLAARLPQPQPWLQWPPRGDAAAPILHAQHPAARAVQRHAGAASPHAGAGHAKAGIVIVLAWLVGAACAGIALWKRLPAGPGTEMQDSSALVLREGTQVSAARAASTVFWHALVYLWMTALTVWLHAIIPP